MATVPNLAALGSSIFPVDPPLCSPNRSVAGEPNTLLTPLFVGEIALDTTNNAMWRAVGLANNTWVMLTPI